MVRNHQWTDNDREINEQYTIIMEGWGLRLKDIGGYRTIARNRQRDIEKSWSPPLDGTFKINFDGASKGNSGQAGYNGVCRDSKGAIMYIYYGSIGMEMKNSAELKGLMQGLKIVSKSGWLLVVVEGDSQVIL